MNRSVSVSYEDGSDVAMGDQAVFFKINTFGEGLSFRCMRVL